ncbi:hypothetical protein SLA2020_155060 [Shorea laevis]
MISKASVFLLLISIPFFALFLPCHCNCDVRSVKDVNGVRGIFVFGSSLVDNGNNNFLKNSLAKADYLPYGIDFPSGPSGRFTNGKNVIDLLTEQLKLPSLIPPFSQPETKGNKIIHGVNFASGASGILDDTGLIVGNITSLNQQIKNFEEVTLPQLEKEMSCKGIDLVANYLFVVGSGGNDYSFNYFLKRSNRSSASLQAFTSNLTLTLSQQLKKLYNLGARKFVLMSINPLGCSPVMLAFQPERHGCIRGLNQAAQLFNTQLRLLISSIKMEMPGSNLVMVNSYKIIRDIIQNPQSKGFEDASSPCCEVVPRSQGGDGILCKKGGRVCGDRNAHVFFDGLHPTEAVNVEIATKAFASYRATEVYPINVHQLAKL